MFYISSYTLKQRNDALHLLFQKEKDHLAGQIHYEKELLFTKRIYHTHHKAEKVMGFIKEDLRSLSAGNIEEVKHRVITYSNFIARVIYDMKWFDPPVQTVRSPLFRTNVNAVIRFLISNMFQRVPSGSTNVRFDLRLADELPAVRVNEFVVWEAVEPVIQNCVEHASVRDLVVTITTAHDAGRGVTTIIIEDNGVGLPPWLLERDPRGVRRVFLETVSTRDGDGRHSGYGCYIAHEIATQRCGWELDAENRSEGGARFTFTIPTQG
jgi:signal transduction histidine kinase